jgi:acetyl-CoA synthetase
MREPANAPLAPDPGASFNLADYDKTYRTFDWKSVEAAFTWPRTGRVNMAHEAIDRHVLEGRGHRRALIYVDGDRRETFTFADLARESRRFASVLARLGVARGDRVGVFMPRRPEVAIGILGILRLGAIPAPISDVFMDDAVRERLRDAQACALLTHRDLLARVPVAELPDLRQIVVTGGGGSRHASVAAEGAHASPAGDARVHDWAAAMADASEGFETVWLGREDPLILHYTAGATGRPKGALHAQAAMIGHLQTGRWVLDLREGDVVWCTAHPGRLTGTSYGMFAPWLAGVTTVLYGGPFDAAAWYDVLESLGVTVWYTAPRGFRMLEAAGEDAARLHDLGALRHVLSTGETLSPELVRWGRRVLGRRIHDTWLATETGHHLIANFPGVEIRPGSMGKAVPGVEAAILDPHGHRVPPRTLGLLCIKAGWPGMMRRVWNDPARTAALQRFPGWTWWGDTATCDEDGWFWFQGRADGVIEVDGEPLGPFEIESAIATHPDVADAGVIGVPDARHGQVVHAFVALRATARAREDLARDIAAHVARRLGPHAAPAATEFVAALPRARNGRIDRRALARMGRPQRA